MTAAQSTGVSLSDVRQNVIDIVKVVLDRDGIDPAVDLFDQGATSLAFLRVVAQVNTKYGIAVDVAVLEEATVDQLSSLVEARISPEGRPE